MKTKKPIVFIELLLDLALVAILCGVMISYYGNMEKKITSKICKRGITLLKIAVLSYYENKTPRAYPPTTDNLCADYLLKAKPQVIRNILYDPFLKIKQEFHYAVSPNGKYYCIWSVGKNGRSNIQGIDDAGKVIKIGEGEDLYVTTSIDFAEF